MSERYRDAPRHRDRSRSRSPHRARRRDDDNRERRRSASPRRQCSETRWKEVNKPKVVTLDEYRRDYKAGKYAGLSFRDKMAMFGTGHMPVFVPLAPGETEDQYETRFREWLRRLHRPLEKIREGGNPFKERELRVDFGIANVHGYERFETFDWSKHSGRSSSASTDADSKRVAASAQSAGHKDGREAKSTSRTADSHTQDTKSRSKEETKTKDMGGDAQRDDKPATTTKTGRPLCLSKDPSRKSGLPPAVLAETQLTCGCTPCLFAVMDQMAQQVHEIESAHAQSAARVVDLTHEK